MKSANTLSKHAIALAVAQLLIPTSVQAATINVDETCSLREAIVSANNDSQENSCEQGSGADVISLAADSLIELTEIDALGEDDAGTPLITSALTIDGNNSTLARANSAPDMRLLQVVAGGSLTVDSLTLTGGNNKSGAAIFADNANTLVLTNSVVTGNNAASGIGGGITSSSTNIYIKDSQIYNNSGRIATGINIRSAHLDLLNSDVSGNVNTQSKSGVYIDTGSLTMSESTINSNSGASRTGIVMYAPSGAVNISDSEISGNSSSNQAGIYIYGENIAEVTVSNTTINGNMSGREAGFYLYTYGSGMTNTQLLISGSEITDNVSSSRSVAGLKVVDRNDLLLEDSLISGNQSNGAAGVIVQSAAQYQPTVIIRNTDVISNNTQYGDITSTSFTNEAGFYVSNSPSTVLENVLITDNKSIKASGVWSKSSTVTITDSRIENNESISVDHAPIIFTDSNVTLRTTSVAGNTSAQGHGGILVSGGESELSIYNTTLSGNTAIALEGSALQVDSAASITMANSTISGNIGLGAALVFSSVTNLSLTNTTVADNQYANGAGGISIVAQPTVFSLNNMVFAANGTSDCAAALIFDGGNNWFQDGSCIGVAQGAAGLESLADNGGETLTHALAASSPLINAGNPSICNSSPILGLDQRGVARENTCDIGAYEYIEPGVFFVIPTKQGGSVIVEL